MREIRAHDGREAGTTRDRSGDGDGRGERWACLLHDAAYYAARAVAEGRLRPEAARGPVPDRPGTEAVGVGAPRRAF